MARGLKADPRRRRLGRAAAMAGLLAAFGLPLHAAEGDDPYGSLPWPDIAREYLPGRVVFDTRVKVSVPAFAEDPMNVPVTVDARALPGVERIVVLVDRNPIRRVLEYQPLAGALPAVSFRFKLEQASPVRAAARTADGRWHVGSAWVESAGGGCTAPAATRQDGSWSKTLGGVSARVFPQSTVPGADGARVRVRVMHPMDTGLVAGVPAFYVNRLALRDAQGRELMRLATYEPVSENPVFSFDFEHRPRGALRLVGTDNNGNRVDGIVANPGAAE